MSSDDIRKQFDAQLDALWRRYLAHCKEINSPHVGREFFEAQVMGQIARMSAQRSADIIPEEDWGHSIYISARASNGPMPIEVVTRKCAQCGEIVWIDEILQDKADKAKAIICSVCVPEITGKPYEQIVKDFLDPDHE